MELRIISDVVVVAVALFRLDQFGGEEDARKDVALKFCKSPRTQCPFSEVIRSQGFPWGDLNLEIIVSNCELGH